LLRCNECDACALVARTSSSACTIDDYSLFANEDDEEEESAFVMYVLCLFVLERRDADMDTRRGQFTDDIGEDFLGLRELGIAAELGLSSLMIPKRLLKGKKNAKGLNAA